MPDPERLEAGFDRRASEFAAAARRVRTGADAEAIHDLRVATRRLVAALRVWRDLVPPRARRDAVGGLRKLRRRLGRARELEAHVALIEARRPVRGADERTAVDPLLERLRERLARRRRSAMKRVGPRRLKRLLRLIEAAGSELSARLLADPRVTLDTPALERRVSVAAADALRNATAHLENDSLHEARIRVKKWRYTLECLAEAVPHVRWRATRPLQRIQATLGDIRDGALLQEMLERRAAEAADERDRDELRAMIDRLDAERERDVRRFRRLAAAHVVGLVDDAPIAAAGGAGPAPAVGPGPPPAAAARAAGGASGAAAITESATGAAEDPQEERWRRIATWLEKSGSG